MKAFDSFMAKIPAEYVPKLGQAINHAAQVLSDPAATGAQYQAVADKLQSLQQKVRFDSSKAAADAWKQAIEKKLIAQLAARLEDQGMAPQEAARKAAELLTPQVNKLLKDAEFFRTKRRLLKRAVTEINWGNLAFSALGWSALAILLGIGYHYSAPAEKSEPTQSRSVSMNMPSVPSIPKSNVPVKGFDQNLNAQSEKAVKLLQDEMRRRDEILMSEEKLRKMKAALAQTVAIRVAPAAIAILPPRIRAIAARPVAVTITEPDQEPITYQRTIGAVVVSIPEPERERFEQIITSSITNESDTSSKSESATQSQLHVNFTPNTPTRQLTHIDVTGLWKNQ